MPYIFAVRRYDDLGWAWYDAPYPDDPGSGLFLRRDTPHDTAHRYPTAQAAANEAADYQNCCICIREVDA